MTGPEHYEEAERLLELAEKPGMTAEGATAYSTMAVGHALLAQTAASISVAWMEKEILSEDEWKRALVR